MIETICNHCGDTFQRKTTRDGKMCRPCYNKYLKETGKKREYNFRQKYGVTVQWYEETYQEQGGRCKICGEKFDVLCVDHCHETGHVRGLLCNGCNKGIGLLGDCSNNLLQAAIYLEAASEVEL
jgi:hypothetical protein